MNAKVGPSTVTHSAGCPQPGFRYGATRKSDGKVVMLCKNPRCSAVMVWTSDG